MTNDEERTALCALNRIFGYHPRLAAELMERHGSAGAVFSARDVELPGHPELAEQLRPEMLEWAAGELRRIQEGGYRFLTCLDEDYPPPLLEISDPPLGLYLHAGTSPTELFALRPMLSFVGTRDMSPYGKAWCRRLVEGLSRARVQPCIVSGLALGVDGTAHRAALECGLPTVAVMATGIGSVYPWQHRELAAEIVRTPGCGLLSDYPLGTPPVALNFVRRNRIIAGLAQAVVVVESKTRGGSLMTARYAVEYGRDVYAVPGRLDDVRSAGCNSLIRTNMAEIITSPEDLAARLGLAAPVRGEGASWAGLRNPPADTLRSRLERRYGTASLPLAVGMAVKAGRGISIEELSRNLRRPVAEILPAVGLLEADGFLSTDLLRRCSLCPPWD